jgi:hypothetical protein
MTYTMNSRTLQVNNSITLAQNLKDSIVVTTDSNLVDFSTALLDLADVAIFANQYKSTVNTTGIIGYSDKIQNLKQNIEKYVDFVLTHSNPVNTRVTNSQDVQYENNNFNLAVYTTNVKKTRLLKDEYTEYTYVDFTNCENVLRQKNNIPDTQSIIVSKFEYSKDNFTSDMKLKQVVSEYSVKIYFYNSVTKQQLSTTGCTGDNAIIYNLPIQTSPGILDIEKYHDDKSETFEPFNKDDIAYHTRCVHKIDSKYGADTTINYRRKNYWQHYNAVCPSNCVYKGIDVINHFKCSCDTADKEIMYWFDEYVFEDLRTVNLDVVTCPHIAFIRPEIHFNPGFYVGLLLNCFFILFLIFLCKFRTVVFRGDTSDLYYFDFLKSKDEHAYDFAEKPKQVEMNNKRTEKVVEAPKDVEKPQQTREMFNEEKEPVATVGSIMLEEKNDGKQITLFTASKKGKTTLEARNGPKGSSAPPDLAKIRITLRDIKESSPYEAFVQGKDQRTACKYLSDYLSDKTFFSLFTKTSIITPLWVRTSYALLFWSILWTINAMMFSDEYIDARVGLPQPQRVIY